MAVATSVSYELSAARWVKDAVLLFDSATAREDARSLLASEGWHVFTEVSARSPSEFPKSAGLLWAEFAEPPTIASLELLTRIDDGARAGRFNAIISASQTWIDLLAAKVTSPAVPLLVEASPHELIAALAVVEAGATSGVRDTSPEKNDARLKQLSDEVNRIAAALARLSSTPVSLDTARPVQPGEGPAVPAETIRSIIRARRLRDQFLPGELFADPAWDILLDLLQAEIIQHRVPVSSLCIASAVPATTALRWIRTLTDRHLLLRREDPHDARRVFIELAPTTSSALRHYFEKIGTHAVV